MARYRRRYYRRVYQRKRWATNIGVAQSRIMFAQGETTNMVYTTICQNSAQNANPTPVLLKVARIKLKGDLQAINVPAGTSISAVAYITFVPEGIDLGNGNNAYNLIANHPEYIMGWTQISLDSTNSFTVSTRLKRNLNSGDSICLIITSKTNHEHPVQASINYGIDCTFQYWTTSA